MYVAAFSIDDTEGCASALVGHTEAQTISHDGRPNLAAAFVLADDGLSTLTPEGAAECLYNDSDRATVDWAVSRLAPHPLLNLTEAVRLAGAQERCDEVVTWPLDHSPFLSDPACVVDLLARVADT